MAQPFLSQIEIFPFNFAPKGWAMCNGQTLPINQNQALFALLGTTYGGDGRTNFRLPNLQGRVPIGQGNGHILGEIAGTETHTLIVGELPQHVHSLHTAANPDLANNTNTPGPTVVLSQTTGRNAQGQSIPVPIYVADNAPSQLMDPSAISPAGGGQPHANMMPYTVFNVCIALQGIFPSQN